MKTQFKILLLMLITSIVLNAQSHKVYSDSFVVNKNTTAIFNLENINVAIEESTDGKIYIDYNMEFDGYSKKEIQSFLDEIAIKVDSFDNHITLIAESKNKISFEIFEFNTDDAISIKREYLQTKKDSIVRKSIASLSAEVERNNHSRTNNPLKYINDRFIKVDKNGRETNFKKKGVNIMRSQFVIKIPPYLKLTVNAKESGLYIKNDLRNELSVILHGGSLKAKSILNAHNKIKVENANFEARAILGGDYEFTNLKNSKIVSIENVKVKSEFSKVEIGEIRKGNTITDFNSEYLFYNWSDNFERFNLYSEYSKIHFFYPRLDFSFKVIGNNTKNFVGKYQINMQPTSKDEKYNMLERKPKGEGLISGQIFFDIIHGIIYSYSDSIIKKTTN